MELEDLTPKLYVSRIKDAWMETNDITAMALTKKDLKGFQGYYRRGEDSDRLFLAAERPPDGPPFDIAIGSILQFGDEPIFIGRLAPNKFDGSWSGNSWSAKVTQSENNSITAMVLNRVKAEDLDRYHDKAFGEDFVASPENLNPDEDREARAITWGGYIAAFESEDLREANNIRRHPPEDTPRMSDMQIKMRELFTRKRSTPSPDPEELYELRTDLASLQLNESQEAAVLETLRPRERNRYGTVTLAQARLMQWLLVFVSSTMRLHHMKR